MPFDQERRNNLISFSVVTPKIKSI